MCLILSSYSHGATEADGRWIEENFNDVYKYSLKSGSPKGKLLLELKLLDEAHKKMLRDVIRERRKWSDYELDQLELESEPLAEKFLAGLRVLKEAKLVFVEEGSISDYEAELRGEQKGLTYDSRTGVMNLTDFKKLYGDKPINNTGITSRINYLVEGKKILIDGNYAELFGYLEFANKYNSDTKRWEPKNDRWESVENAIYRKTEEVLAKISSTDPLYLSGPSVRETVAARINDIPKMKFIDPMLKIPSIPLAVENLITGVNLYQLAHRVKNFEEYKVIPESTQKELLELTTAKGKFLEDLIAFAAKEERDLGLVYGHFCVRHYKK